MLHKTIQRVLTKTALLAGLATAAMLGAHVAQAQPVIIAPPHISGPVVVVQPPPPPVVVRRHRAVRPIIVPAPVYVRPHHVRRHGYYGHRPIRRDGRPVYRDGRPIHRDGRPIYRGDRY